MDLFKLSRFMKQKKSKSNNDPIHDPMVEVPEGHEGDNLAISGEMGNIPTTAYDNTGEEDDYDDDEDEYITNEVKRRLKDLRNNSFMVLIPEESSPGEEEEDEETSSSEWQESDGAARDVYSKCVFDNRIYEKYSERMLFFDKMIAQQLPKAEPWSVSNHSSKSTSKRLILAFRSFSFKEREELQGDYEHLQQSPDDDPYQNLETAYVAHICLTWEALHNQYTQLSQKTLSLPEELISYCYTAQAFQEFHVLLQRFIENEPFENGTRVEVYSRARSLLPRLLEVPNFQGLNQQTVEEDDYGPPVPVADLIKTVEEAILTFHLFLKADKNKSNNTMNFFRGISQNPDSLQQVQISLNKKEVKLKELSKKKAWKKKSWPSSPEEAELLLGVIDIKVVCRVLRMAKISKEQLLWCEEKMSKLDVSMGRLVRDSSPILFPC